MRIEEDWLRADIAVLLCAGNPETVRERATDRAMSPEHVMHACLRAVEITARSDGDLAPFGQWEATPPGCLDVRVFDQDQYWVDAVRVAHRINDPEDMTDGYLYALIEFLSKHAEHMLSGYRRMQPTAVQEAGEWLESTTLMRGLRREELRRRKQSDSRDEPC